MVDDVTRECPAAIPDTAIPGRRVARELTALPERRGKPGRIVSDNVLGWEDLADLAIRSQGNRVHDCLYRTAQAGSAVKNWSLP